jgi:hypothetical protein
MRKAVATLIVAIAAAVLWTSLRPGTPARTYDAYELKAKDTAESVLSSVETARLVARAGTDGDAFGPYVSVSLSEAETAVGDAADSFAGLQPPDNRADRLRSRLTAITERADEIVSELRIDARRGMLDGLARTARPLAQVSARLERFVERHGG